MKASVEEVSEGLYLVIGPRTNWCLVREDDSVTLVDAAWPKDYPLVVDSLEQIGASVDALEAVVLTHAHPDHVGVAERLRKEQEINVLVHRDEVGHATGEYEQRVSISSLAIRLWRPSVLAFFLNSIIRGGLKPTHLVDVHSFEGGPLDVPGRPVPIPTPGHTAGHCSYHLPDRGAVITGDALVNHNLLTDEYGPRLLPRIFNYDREQAVASLDRLAALDAEMLLPGHGPTLKMTPAAAVDEAKQRAARGRWWDR